MSAKAIWAVMPIKNMENAKQRLAPALSPAERRLLFSAMVEDALSVLTSAKGLAGTLVVTRDPEARRLAEHYGARVLIENANAGHTEASSFGARTLAAEGFAGMIQIPGDLPALRPADIEAVLEVHDEAPAVTIAPSRDERGSNAVACSPPDVLPLRFGDDSFFPHLERARELGVEPRIVRRPGLALDVDMPEDLKAFLAIAEDGHTRRYLETSGIARRLARENEG